MGRSGRGSAYHPSSRDERSQDAKDHSNSRALAHLRLQERCKDWLERTALRSRVLQVQATLDALLGEEHDEDISVKIASWYEELEQYRPELHDLNFENVHRNREAINELWQTIVDEGFALFPLAERVVVDGFDGAFEHFNGVYQAVRDGSRTCMQLFAHIGDMDKGFEERRHGVVELGSPYLQLVGGCWSVCEEFGDRKNQTRAEIASDVFSPEHITSESAWSCFRKGSRDIESHTVTICLAADIDLTPQKRWHKATPNLPSWASSNMPPADIDDKRSVQSLLSKLGGRKAKHVEPGEMPNKRDLIRTKQKNQIRLRTTRELRLQEGTSSSSTRTTADEPHSNSCASNIMDAAVADQVAVLVNPEAVIENITADVQDSPPEVNIASDGENAHASDAAVTKEESCPQVLSKGFEAFRGCNMYLYACPKTGRNWFWHPETEAAYFEDDLRDVGWQKFFDGTDQQNWWWHQSTQDWFLERCSMGD